MGGVREWTALDQEEWNQPQPENLQGVDIVAFVSPYDVPEAVRSYYDKDNRIFVIEFKYIGGKEALKSATSDRHVTLWVGRDSKRLHRIDLKGRPQEPKWMLRIVPEVDEAIDGLSSKRQVPPRTGNYELAKRILEKLLSTPSATNPFGQLPEPT
jgi:hypothetical protein